MEKITDEQLEKICKPRFGWHPVLLVERLQIAQFSNEQVARIVEIIDETCHECWDAPRGCRCWDDS